MTKPVVLCILDGWGISDRPEQSAPDQAATPNFDRLMRSCPHATLTTFGPDVGLPRGQMGNSEVGHMNLGAGRIVYQDLTRIDAAIEDGSFFANAELRAACAAANSGGGTLHLMGLLSPGGVHSHETHIFAMLELARRENVAHVAVHAFLDGRDMPPQSAQPSLAALQAKCDDVGNARIASTLFLSEKAVVQHTSNIYEALGLPVDADDHRRVLAVIRFLASAADDRL